MGPRPAWTGRTTDPASRIAPKRPGLDALHVWCVLCHVTGDGTGLAFGGGHTIRALPSGVNTTIRIGDFVDRWDPEEEPLTDHEIPMPDRDTGLIDQPRHSIRLRALYGWRMHRGSKGRRRGFRTVPQYAEAFGPAHRCLPGALYTLLDGLLNCDPVTAIRSSASFQTIASNWWMSMFGACPLRARLPLPNAGRSSLRESD